MFNKLILNLKYLFGSDPGADRMALDSGQPRAPQPWMVAGTDCPKCIHKAAQHNSVADMCCALVQAVAPYKDKGGIWHAEQKYFCRCNLGRQDVEENMRHARE